MATKDRETKVMRLRAKWLASALACLLFVVVARLYSMQVRGHDSYVERAASMYGHKVPVPAPRGVIYDSAHRPLASSITTYRISVNPAHCPAVPAFHAELAVAAGISPAHVAAHMLYERGYALMTKGLSKNQADAVRSVARRWRADGISLEPELQRLYPNGRLAAHVIGFVSKDGRPMDGVEKSFAEFLKGRDGVNVSSSGLLPGSEEMSVPAVPGKDVALTIDLELQEAVTEALQEALEKHNASTAVAIVMDPANGDVLSMVSLPDYDPNDPGLALKALPKKHPENTSPLRNSAVHLVFAPGSTFKMLTVAAALDCGAITLNTPTYCSGTRAFGGVIAGCAAHEGSRAHGQCIPMRAMTVSCNLSAGEYAQKIGAARFLAYIRDFACVDKTGLGLPGEQRGLLEPEKAWGNPAHQLAVIGFGQSINVTPLALATAMTALAGDGQVVLPRLVQRVGERELPVRKGKKVVSPKVAATLRGMLQSVVEDQHGTGHEAAVAGFHVGGKTGTAQRPDPVTHKMSHALFDSYFVGMVPAGNPRAIVLVMVDEPKQNGFYGGAVSAPVFAKIAKYLVNRWRLSPDLSIVPVKEKK